MPETKPEMPPEATADPDKERGSKNVTVEIIDRINLNLRARETKGIIEAIVDNTDQPRIDRIEQDGLLVDEVTMDALGAFFEKAGVGFTGDPRTTSDQEDFLGEVSISAADLNQALNERKLVLSRRDPGDTYSFEDLDQFVEKFVDIHFSDEKYNPEDP